MFSLRKHDADDASLVSSFRRRAVDFYRERVSLVELTGGEALPDPVAVLRRVDLELCP